MTLLPKLSCLFSALNKYIDNLKHVAVNWKRGLFELCIFFLMLEHFPWEKSQVSWLWKRNICISFWLRTSWYTITFSSFLAHVRHMLLRKVFHPHFSGSFLVYWSTKQNVKGLYFYNSNYASEQLVIIYYVASHWTKMLFSAWLLEVMNCIHKLIKYSNIYLCCSFGENNTPCRNI